MLLVEAGLGSGSYLEDLGSVDLPDIGVPLGLLLPLLLLLEVLEVLLHELHLLPLLLLLQVVLDQQVHILGLVVAAPGVLCVRAGSRSVAPLQPQLFIVLDLTLLSRLLVFLYFPEHRRPDLLLGRAFVGGDRYVQNLDPLALVLGFSEGALEDFLLGLAGTVEEALVVGAVGYNHGGVGLVLALHDLLADVDAHVLLVRALFLPAKEAFLDLLGHLTFVLLVLGLLFDCWLVRFEGDHSLRSAFHFFLYHGVLFEHAFAACDSCRHRRSPGCRVRGPASSGHFLGFLGVLGWF